MKVVAFYEAMPFNVVVYDLYRRFGDTCCLHHLGGQLAALTVDAAESSQKPTTRRHIAKDGYISAHVHLFTCPLHQRAR